MSGGSGLRAAIGRMKKISDQYFTALIPPDWFCVLALTRHSVLQRLLHQMHGSVPARHTARRRLKNGSLAGPLQQDVDTRWLSFASPPRMRLQSRADRCSHAYAMPTVMKMWPDTSTLGVPVAFTVTLGAVVAWPRWLVISEPYQTEKAYGRMRQPTVHRPARHSS
jgi:hypothetical protein